MNEREQFEAWAKKVQVVHDMPVFERLWAQATWEACAESKQSELDTLLRERNDAIQASMNDMSNLDKANARIAQLEEALKCVAHNGFTTTTRHLLNDTLQDSSDTWLSDHDKAVEVRILEEVVRRAGETDTVLDLIEEVKRK